MLTVEIVKKIRVPCRSRICTFVRRTLTDTQQRTMCDKMRKFCPNFHNKKAANFYSDCALPLTPTQLT